MDPADHDGWKNQRMVETQARSARTRKRITSHFPIFHATLPMNPSTMRMTAMRMKMMPRVRIQVVAIPGILDPRAYLELVRVSPGAEHRYAGMGTERIMGIPGREYRGS
jgi:hypothetical protein